MSKMRWMLAALFLCAYTSAALSQADNPAGRHSVNETLEKRLGGVEKLLLGVADVMPADKYSFAVGRGE